MLNKSLETEGRTEIAISKCEETLETRTLEAGGVGNRKKKNVGNARWELLFRHPRVVFPPSRGKSGPVRKSCLGTRQCYQDWPLVATKLLHSSCVLDSRNGL